MIYTATQFNIMALMQRVGTLEHEQLIRFFFNELRGPRCTTLLTKLVLNNYLDFDAETNRYTYSGTPHVTDEVLNKRIKAFWPIAYMGSESVVNVYPLNYPSQFIVSTADNVLYDFTVCNSKSEAQVAKKIFDLHRINNNGEDETSHIAIVPGIEIGKEIEPYGFDAYCILNQYNHAPDYTLYLS